MTSPFVRPYDPTRDSEDGCHVFYTTINPSLAHEPAQTHGSYLWYKPYVFLSPGTCFVLDDGSGKTVGYIIGTHDTAEFTQRWKDLFIPIIDPKILPKPQDLDDKDSGDGKVEKQHKEDEEGKEQEDETLWIRTLVYTAQCSQFLPFPSLLSTYPSHFHIDILPEYQRQGYGTLLMDAFLQKVKALGAKGVHLGMFRLNHGGRAFYERLGYSLCESVLDGGVSGDVGREGEAICLVKKL